VVNCSHRIRPEHLSDCSNRTGSGHGPK
jgi:hypothetical protein